MLVLVLTVCDAVARAVYDSPLNIFLPMQFFSLSLSVCLSLSHEQMHTHTHARSTRHREEVRTRLLKGLAGQNVLNS